MEGSVTKVTGKLVESEGPVCSVGEACEIVDNEGNCFPGEIVGFRGSSVLSMPLGKTNGIRFGDKIFTWGSTPTVAVGPELIGRVLDGSLKPIDNLGPCRQNTHGTWTILPLRPWTVFPYANDRCGIRAIDGFVSCGRGQRIGIFGGSGVGKKYADRNDDARDFR